MGTDDKALLCRCEMRNHFKITLRSAGMCIPICCRDLDGHTPRLRCFKQWVKFFQGL